MIEFNEVNLSNLNGNKIPESKAGILCGIYDCSNGALCGINCDVEGSWCGVSCNKQ